MTTDSNNGGQQKRSGFSLVSSKVRRNKLLLEKIAQLSNQSKPTNQGYRAPVLPKIISIIGHFSGKITTAVHSMDVCMPIEHEVPCEALEPLLDVFLEAAKKHEADLKMHLEERTHHKEHGHHHHGGQHHLHHGATKAVAPSAEHHHDEPPHCSHSEQKN